MSDVKPVTINRKDVAAGAFFVAVGVFYGAVTLKTLTIGKALNMGSGYFPLVLCGLLVLLGTTTMIRGLFTGPSTPFGIVPWRAVMMLSLATIVFAVSLAPLGLLPAVFVASLVASLSSPQIRIVPAAIVSLGIALFCTGVFIYGVKLPVPMFGTFLSGS